LEERERLNTPAIFVAAPATKIAGVWLVSNAGFFYLSLLAFTPLLYEERLKAFQWPL
jgi:hypothetical protein